MNDAKDVGFLGGFMATGAGGDSGLDLCSGGGVLMKTFCATKEPFGDAVCKWPRGQAVTWNVVKPIAKFPKKDYVEICQAALNQWAAICGVRFARTNDRANINITTRKIDASGGVLAEAELPCGTVGGNTQLMVWVDTSENWVHAKNPPAGAMDLLRVLTHEFGHSIGMGHAPANSKNLMAPTVSGIRSPQTGWDIPQSMMRYGDPSQTPPDPDVTPVVPAFDPCTLINTFCQDRQQLGERLAGLRKWIELLESLSDLNACERLEPFRDCFLGLPRAEQDKQIKTLERMRAKAVKK